MKATSVLNRIHFMSAILACSFLGFQLVIISVNVIMRYFFSSGIPWMEEISKDVLMPALLAGDLIHLKTAGTSYLEALRTIARCNPGLFRDIVQFAVGRYPMDRASYHVSARHPTFLILPILTIMICRDYWRTFMRERCFMSLMVLF